MADPLRARDRSELVQQSFGKTAKQPRTDRRLARIESMLERRQPGLTVVLEEVHDPFNVSAVMRSCDAVGVMRVHIVYDQQEPPAQKTTSRMVSGSASKWLQVERHRSTRDCLQDLKSQGYAIAVAGLGQEDVTLYDLDLTRPVALVFGNEHRGASETVLEIADSVFRIPMMGMVESLNISAACAVTLFEALRQRQAAGAYDRPALNESDRVAMLDSLMEK